VSQSLLLKFLTSSSELILCSALMTHGVTDTVCHEPKKLLVINVLLLKKDKSSYN
jgi:hypothetical protein